MEKQDNKHDNNQNSKKYLNNGIKINQNKIIHTNDGLPSKPYKYKGIEFNLENILTYLEYDYWNEDEINDGFWTRMNNHKRIFNKVMEINGYDNTKNFGEDKTKELKQQIYDKSKKFPPIELNLDLDWGDDEP
jgi:hypothetical protein